MTYESMIKNAMPFIGLPRDPLQTDVVELALSIINMEGKQLFDDEDWYNTRIDIFTISPDDDGIITFDGDNSTVDEIKALRSVNEINSQEGEFIFYEDEVRAAQIGVEIRSGSYQRLADDSSGNRRVKVDADSTSTFAILATKRFIEATLANYTTISFPIDKAENVLQKKLINSMRIGWSGLPPAFSDVQISEDVAKRKEKGIGQTLKQFTPRTGSFGDVGCLQ